MIRRALFALAGASVALAACTQAAPAAPTTADPPTVASTTTVGVAGRALEVVGCDDAPDAASVICEVYDLIHTHYVDVVSDDVLASGALDGIELLDGAGETSPIVCVAPSESFFEACSLAPDLAEDTEETTEAMLFGMTSLALDPNSAYLDQDLLTLIEEEHEGQVEGIGAIVLAEDDSSGEPIRCGVITDTCRLIIVSTIPGSPAETAGIRKDDIIIGVEGQDLTGWSVEEVTSAVRGPAGTNVALTVWRDGRSFEVTIIRAEVVIPVVSSDMFGSTGYVRLNQFNNKATDQLEKAIFDLLTEGMTTLVLDLRDNPGGLLSTAIEIASEFLPDGDVVETRGPDATEVYGVMGNVIVPEDVDVIVVVNRGSASASELLAALLQERGRARLVGENTFGKNTVQQQFNLSNGGALKLTIARWVTPGGLDFGGVGVTPDAVEEFPSDLSPEAVVELALSLG